MGSYRIHFPDPDNGRETQRIVEAWSREDAIARLLGEMPALARSDVLRVVFVPG